MPVGELNLPSALPVEPYLRKNAPALLNTWKRACAKLLSVT